MYIRMKFIVGVTLLVIQLSSLRALQPDDTSEKDKNYLHKLNTIIVDIKSRRFERALEKMQTLEDDIQGNINFIVHDTYNNAESNSDLILQLVDKNVNVTTSLAIYEALNDEMNRNNHNDHLLRLKVMKSFNSKNLRTSEAEKLKSELHKIVSGIVVEELKNAIETKNSTAISTVSENIFMNYRDLFDEAIRQVLKERFDKIDRTYLVKLFMSHKYISQRIFVYAAVFEELKRRYDLNESLVITLARGLKEALPLSFKWALDEKSYRKGFQLKSDLPESVRMIAFASQVCIVNKNGEYLYGASDDYSYYTYPEGRRIFTWILKARVTQGIWIIEPHGDVYRIKNFRNESRSEYMFAPTLGISNASPSREVFTWIPGGTKKNSKEFDWTFEPKGSYIYIRNEPTKEYLFSGAEDVVNRRYVYTDRSKVRLSVKGSSLWTVENCSHYIE